MSVFPIESSWNRNWKSQKTRQNKEGQKKIVKSKLKFAKNLSKRRGSKISWNRNKKSRKTRLKSVEIKQASTFLKMSLYLSYEDQTDFDGILNQLQEAENVDHIGKIYDKMFFTSQRWRWVTSRNIEIVRSFWFLIGPKIPSFVHHNNQPIKYRLKSMLQGWHLARNITYLHISRNQ